MSRAVWIYRHAESVANAGGRTRDVADIPLSPKGVEQAHALAVSIEAAPEVIVNSPFLRAAQTAAPICDRFAAADRYVWPIEEFTYLDPAACVNTSWVERKPLIDAYWARLDPHHVDGPGAESFAMLMERARAFLAQLTTIDTAHAVFVSHGQFMQATRLAAELPGLSAHDAMTAFRDRQAAAPFANCERLRLVVRDAVVRVEGRG